MSPRREPPPRTGVASVDRNIEALEALRDEVRTAVREGHELLRDLRAERRELEKLVGDENMRRLLDEAVDRVMLEPVKAELDRVVKLITEARDHSLAQIDRWTNLITTGRERGMTSIEASGALLHAPDSMLADEVRRRALEQA